MTATVNPALQYLRNVHDGHCEPSDDVIEYVLLPLVLGQPGQDGH